MSRQIRQRHGARRWRRAAGVASARAGM